MTTVSAAVIAFRKSDKTRIKGIARLGKALSESKDDPIEPARFVPERRSLECDHL
jgi:hypothetical protein